MNTTETSQRSHNELLKEASPTLAGTIAATLADPAADRFSDDDNQFLKFHGIYQQDDRDRRKTGKFYSLMIRGRIPGGIMTPAAYLIYDDLSTRHGNGTLRITSRQSFQFHGVVKSQLGALMKSLNQALLTTIAACGDVARNVMAPPTPATNGLAAQLLADASRVSDALAPTTPAYHAIWLNGVQLDLAAPENKDFADPLYGKTYLPRKFKVAFALPPLNDVDLFTNCLGFIAIADDAGRLLGYNLTAGGGMGRSHGNAQTYPRLADVVGFLTPDRVIEAAKATLTIHRDFGDRADRKHARLKYVIEEKGAAWFRTELEQRLGFKLGEPKPFEFKRQGDLYGWHKQADGRLFLGLFIEAGRIKDTDGCRLKTALSLVVEKFKPEIRLTPSQNLILAGVAPEHRAEITTLFTTHGVQVDRRPSPTRGAAMACVALPTCGLALAEAERFLPALVGNVEGLLTEIGLADEEIIIRTTGCPNGCVRPYMAEMAFVGKAPGRYQIYFGGNEASSRMNRLWKDGVKEAEIQTELRPVLTRFAGERIGRERFGDWCERVLWKEQPAAK